MTQFLYFPFFLLLCPQSKNIDILLSYIIHLISFKRIFFVLIKLLNLICTFKIIISYKILLVTIRNLGQAEPKQTDEIIMNIDKDSPRQPQPYNLYREAICILWAVLDQGLLYFSYGGILIILFHMSQHIRSMKLTLLSKVLCAACSVLTMLCAD